MSKKRVIKKTLLILALCWLATTTKSQSTSVEKSTFGIQTGVLGIWAYNEVKQSDAIALRTEREHFNYQAGIGAGISHTFAENAGYSEDKTEIELNMHLRLGNRF